MNLQLIPATAAKPHPEEADVERPYLRLAAQILALLVQKGVKAGDRLPSERALAEQF